ncbi:oxaloacetate decarboxylase subunit alpha [Clostridium polynesiense]|uniref:oxaloacetate decarboxylase subunit alpha n=1 Tax=Clostridium polynesiense TaxID=1325933 RepID=UPI0005902808|nr:oxaloacetate decarboxylase subunit alpha [Clostridium polynesiense]
MDKVKITETALRDGHQSLIATRLSTEEIIPILEKMDEAGYYSLEIWGGATFDASLRFLKEDPWERLRKIRRVVKKTKLQMLLRGQNLLGYKHYADDVVEAFIEKSIENGIDIIRVFDALNDVRNLETSIRAVKKFGGHCQCALSYTISPVHTTDYYINLAKKMQELGAHSICIKDMAGILTPYTAYELVSELKKVIDIPIELHTHSTSGIASMTYLKAVEAGVDIIDTAISPFGEGTSQPSTESLAVTLSQGSRGTDLNLDLLNDIAEYFKPIKEKYRENGILNPKVMDVEPKTLTYQVPGGMLSNLLSQLKQQGALDKYEEVLREIPRVREDLGYPPLVTPLSQMVGTQAVFNVLSGQRYKMVPKEIKEYVKGLYGKSPAPIKEEIRSKIIGDEEVITVRPADLIKPEIEKARDEIGEIAESFEDVLSYILFPQVAKSFFEYRTKGEHLTEEVETKEDKGVMHYITVTM